MEIIIITEEDPTLDLKWGSNDPTPVPITLPQHPVPHLRGMLPLVSTQLRETPGRPLRFGILPDSAIAHAPDVSFVSSFPPNTMTTMPLSNTNFGPTFRMATRPKYGPLAAMWQTYPKIRRGNSIIPTCFSSMGLISKSIPRSLTHLIHNSHYRCTIPMSPQPHSILFN